MSEPTSITAFESFRKIPRLSREIVITEKIDGTNAQILIVPRADLPIGTQATYWDDNFVIFTGSRNRWIYPGADNFGFAAWVQANAQELLKLGPGRHFGEWFGSGIQRGYGLKEKRFALFNVGRWTYDAEARSVEEWGTRMPHPGVIDLKTGVRVGCCYVVPVLYTGPFCTEAIGGTLVHLEKTGSVIVPGFDKPEGIVIYHKASGCLFKKTVENDESGKAE